MAEDKGDGLLAQKELLLEPRDLCCALFYGRVTRPRVSVPVKAPLRTGIGPSAICCRSLLKYSSISEESSPTDLVHKYKGSIVSM